jgi:hypothetical protein
LAKAKTSETPAQITVKPSNQRSENCGMSMLWIVTQTRIAGQRQKGGRQDWHRGRNAVYRASIRPRLPDIETLRLEFIPAKRQRVVIQANPHHSLRRVAGI